MILKAEDLEPKRKAQLLWPLSEGPPERSPRVADCLLSSLLLNSPWCVSSGSGTEEPQRYTKLGWVKGKQVTVLGSLEPVNVFLGIPFAAPPLGDLRFSSPRPAIPWLNLREATSYPSL